MVKKEPTTAKAKVAKAKASSTRSPSAAPILKPKMDNTPTPKPKPKPSPRKPEPKSKRRSGQKQHQDSDKKKKGMGNNTPSQPSQTPDREQGSQKDGLKEFESVPSSAAGQVSLTTLWAMVPVASKDEEKMDKLDGPGGPGGPVAIGPLANEDEGDMTTGRTPPDMTPLVKGRVCGKSECSRSPGESPSPIPPGQPTPQCMKTPQCGESLEPLNQLPLTAGNLEKLSQSALRSRSRTPTRRLKKSISSGADASPMLAKMRVSDLIDLT